MLARSRGIAERAIVVRNGKRSAFRRERPNIISLGQGGNRFHRRRQLQSSFSDPY